MSNKLNVIKSERIVSIYESYIYNTSLHFMQTKSEMEEKVLINVLNDYLGRNPNISDAIKCNKVYKHLETHTYSFTYDGILLGTVTISSSVSRLVVEFEPVKELAK